MPPVTNCTFNAPPLVGVLVTVGGRDVLVRVAVGPTGVLVRVAVGMMEVLVAVGLLPPGVLPQTSEPFK